MGLFDKVKGVFDTKVKPVLDNNPEIKENLKGIGKNLEGIGDNVGNIVDNVVDKVSGKTEGLSANAEQKISDFLNRVEQKVDEMNPNVYKMVNPPEMIEELRKDLSIKLLDNHAELIKNALPGVKLANNELAVGYDEVSCNKNNLGSMQSGVKGPTFIRGFTARNEDLAVLVDHYECGDKGYRIQRNEEGMDVSDGEKVAKNMMKFCERNLYCRNMNFGNKYAYNPCVVASDLTTDKVNKVIDEELDKFFVALDNNSESGAKLHLQNARAAMVVYNNAVQKWNEKLTDNVIEDVLQKNLEKRLNKEIEMQHKFREPNMKEFMENEVTTIRNENDKLKKNLLDKTFRTAKSSFKDYVKSKDSTLFKVATGFALQTQTDKINEINNNIKRIEEVYNKYVNLDMQDETMVSVLNTYKNKGQKAIDKKAEQEKAGKEDSMEMA